MTLIVRTPPGREAERRYVLDVVLGRWWGVDWRHIVEARTDVRIEADDTGADHGVTLPDVLLGVPADAWLAPASVPGPVPWRPVGPAGAGPLRPGEELPVPYGSPGATGPATLLELDGPRATVGVDVFGAAFFMLTRYEELAVHAGDEHDRFPGRASVARRDGFAGLPVVDAWAEVLWLACSHVWPRLTRRSGTYRVQLTHDVDDPLSTLGRGPARVARQFAGDVVRRRDPGLVLRRARALARSVRGDHGPDPHNTFDFLMDVTERHGARSAFYFLAHNDVDPDGAPFALFDHPWVRSLIGRVHRRGHEVGLHAAFGTYLDAGRTAVEFDRLRDIAEREGVAQDRWGGRQHYLQWRNPTTWRNWDAAGLDYDATLGFSDAAGFRTGTCHEYPVFDLVERRPLRLVEAPFQVMDVAVADDTAAPSDSVRRTVVDIARECRRFGGTFGLLWHNDEVLRTARQQRWYRSLVADVVAPGD